MTPRVSLDDRNRLYFRASNIDEIVNLLGNLQEGSGGSWRSKEKYKDLRTGEHVLFLGMQIRLPAVFRSVLKTGFNLVAATSGSEVSPETAYLMICVVFCLTLSLMMKL